MCVPQGQDRVSASECGPGLHEELSILQRHQDASKGPESFAFYSQLALVSSKYPGHCWSFMQATKGLLFFFFFFLRKWHKATPSNTLLTSLWCKISSPGGRREDTDVPSASTLRPRHTEMEVEEPEGLGMSAGQTESYRALPRKGVGVALPW